MRFPVVLETAPQDTCYLALTEEPSDDALTRRQLWLGDTR